MSLITVSELDAGARGVPGGRTFYLIAGSGGRWVRFWLEKEQLQTLGTSIEELLVTLAEPDQPESQEASQELLSAGEPPGAPAAEFRVGQLGLAHDTGRDMVALVAQERREGTGSPVTLQFWASKSQMRALSQRIAEVCASGRPICPLCGGPIDPEGHPCIRTNGHHPLAETR